MARKTRKLTKLRSIRRRGRGRSRKASRFEWSLCISGGLILAAICIGLLQQRLYPLFQEAAATQLRAEVEQKVEQLITEEILDDFSYESLVNMQYDNEGRIAAATTDTAQVTRLKNEVAAQVEAMLVGMGSSSVNITLGDLTGFAPLSGFGMQLRLRVQGDGPVRAQLGHDFTEAGINQSRQQLRLKVDIPLKATLSGKVWKDTVTVEMLVGETVIVGAVPKTYLSF